MFTTAQCQKPLTVGASGFLADAAIDASAMAGPSTAGARFGFCRLATTKIVVFDAASAYRSTAVRERARWGFYQAIIAPTRSRAS